MCVVLLHGSGERRRIRDHTPDGCHERFGVAGNQHATLFRQHLGEIPDRRGDDRDPGGERLEHDIGHAFAVRREQQQRRIMEERRNVTAGPETMQPGRRSEIGSVNEAPVEPLARQDEWTSGFVCSN